MNDAVRTSVQDHAGATTERFRAARDFLLQHRTDYETAVRDFRWPEFERFNWALDWFDAIAQGNDRPALVIVEEDGRETRRSYAEMARRSNRVANWLRAHGVARGDRIIVMLGNQVELWETILAAMKLGSMGRPLPGYTVALLDPISGQPGEEGEICLDLSARPLGLMVGYRDDPSRTADVMRDGYYHTGDVAARDGEGYITYVGRTDDVFKSSDYRISPFELESMLIEHEAVAEAAVVPAPDPMRLAVPKAYIVLIAGWEPSAATAEAILRFCRERMPAYSRIRRLEFAELPKTISGKIRRVELREREQRRDNGQGRPSAEFREDDFPALNK